MQGGVEFPSGVCQKEGASSQLSLPLIVEPRWWRVLVWEEGKGTCREGHRLLALLCENGIQQRPQCSDRGHQLGIVWTPVQKVGCCLSVQLLLAYLFKHVLPTVSPRSPLLTVTFFSGLRPKIKQPTPNLLPLKICLLPPTTPSKALANRQAL